MCSCISYSNNSLKKEKKAWSICTAQYVIILPCSFIFCYMLLIQNKGLGGIAGPMLASLRQEYSNSNSSINMMDDFQEARAMSLSA